MKVIVNIECEGPEGYGELTIQGRSLHEKVTFPQKGKVVDGGSIPSRIREAIKGTCCPKKGSTRVLIADAGSDDADVAGKSGSSFSDLQGEPNADSVRSEGNIQDVPKKGPSWASIVDAKPDDEDSTNTAEADGVQPDAIEDAGRPKCAGKVAYVSAVNDRDAVRDNPAIADAKENTESRYKVSLTTGKDGFTGVAGSRICNKGLIREWVRIRSNVPDRSGNGSVQPAGPKESSGVAVQATTVKMMGVVVGPISDKSQSTSDREGSALPKPPMLILGLGDDDFPPIRPMSDLGATIKASKLVSESKKKMDGPEVNASLISANTRPQPFRIGSKFDNKFDGRGNGATTAVLHSDDHKVSHKGRSLFANCPKSCSPLAYYNPSTLDGKVTINPPPEAVVEGVGIWEGRLVGQFLDKRLPLHVVKSFVGRLWGKHEIPEISTTDNGLYIFRFKDLDARDWVLENGPWYFAGRPIILRFWKPDMEMLNVQITSLPIWVKFFNIPLEYWTVTSLGYIASVVGIPLHFR